MTTLSKAGLADLLTAAFQKKYPDAPFKNDYYSLHDFLLKVIENNMILKQGPFTWSMDEKKLSFHFYEGEIFSDHIPRRLDFSYEDHPELFKKKYLPPEK